MPLNPRPLGRVTKAKRNSTKATPTGPGTDKRKSLRSASKPTATPTTTTTMPFKTTPASPSSSTPNPPTESSTPVFFWRPNDANGYLGQWYASPFTVDSDTYATAEMWMMVQKARLFQDESVARRMLATTDPKRHKALGREVKGFDGRVWDEHKLDIVEQGTYHKFMASEDAESLRKMLLGTGERELVEASPLDRIWGVGYAEKNAEANRYRWGQNLLGVALMNVRSRLRKEGKE